MKSGTLAGGVEELLYQRRIGVLQPHGLHRFDRQLTAGVRFQGTQLNDLGKVFQGER